LYWFISGIKRKKDKELLRKIEKFLIDLNYEKRVKMSKIGQKSFDRSGVKRLHKTI